MWVIAGVLLGFVGLASLVGFHVGPHSHAAAAIVGAFAAVWLVIMAFSGHSDSLLWTLFSADVVVSGGVGVAAWKGLTTKVGTAEINKASPKPDGQFGVAQTDLTPDGVVLVKGETWSATSMNGTVKAGGSVQVVETEGIRLRVWGEDPELLPPIEPTNSGDSQIFSS